MILCMEKIAIDSNVIISFLDTQDPLHAKAVELSKRIQSEYAEMVILNLILYEVLTILSMKGHKNRAAKFFDEIKGDPWVRIIYADEMIEQAAIKHFNEAVSKNISMADCALIAAAEQEDARAIASFDAHLKRYSKIIPVIY